MDVAEYRESDSEQTRTNDFVQIIQAIASPGQNSLDIGARDGHFSRLLAEKFHQNVTALDLEKPKIEHQDIHCVKGDATNLEFGDNSFEIVFCAEVLEHIPPHMLEKVCSELSRVTKNFLIIGVPYKQDIRVGRTTCYSCGKKNPPWGHVNRFDKNRLSELFPSLTINKVSFVSETTESTNFLSTYLMDLAGNPYGTYIQDEACIHCGKELKKPPARNLLQKVFTKAAFIIKNIQKPWIKT